MNMKWVIAASLTASTITYIAPANEVEAASFQDINAYSDMGDAIETLAARGVMSGYKDGTFRPEQPASRLEVVKTLVAALQLNVSDITEQDHKTYIFKDLSPRNANYQYVVALAKAGIINGYDDGTFKPNKKVTRGEFSVMLQRAYDLVEHTKPLHFSDVPANHPFYPAISMMYANEITKGMTSTKYGINNEVTRGQLALFLYRTEQALLKQPLYQDHLVTFQANELGYESIEQIVTEGDVYKTTMLADSSLMVKAIHPGTARLNFTAYRTIEQPDGSTYIETEDFFYNVTVTANENSSFMDDKTTTPAEPALTIDFERGNMEDNIAFATNTYEYGDGGLNLTFTPSLILLKDDNNIRLSNDEYVLEQSADEMSLTVYKAGVFQLHFSDEFGHQAVKVIQVHDQAFVRDYELEDVKTQLVLDASNLGFEPKSYTFKGLNGVRPVHVELVNGTLTAKAIAIGDGNLIVHGEHGQSRKLYIYGQEKAGLLYLLCNFE